jgi:pyruvate,water dikinase
MGEFGLKQGEHGLEIYAMCELPANVIYADEFLRVFDGYSIGSNDLTQLTLGLDRDSGMVAHLFDERDAAVERMVTIAIDAAQRAGKKIGICGQAPSDYPEFARFLVERGISSISLNPDTVLQTTQVILEAEAELSTIQAISNLTVEASPIGITSAVSASLPRPSTKPALTETVVE